MGTITRGGYAKIEWPPSPEPQGHAERRLQHWYQIDFSPESYHRLSSRGLEDTQV